MWPSSVVPHAIPLRLKIEIDNLWTKRTNKMDVKLSVILDVEAPLIDAVNYVI